MEFKYYVNLNIQISYRLFTKKKKCVVSSRNHCVLVRKRTRENRKTLGLKPFGSVVKNVCSKGFRFGSGFGTGSFRYGRRGTAEQVERTRRRLTVSGGRDEHLDQPGYGPSRGVQLAPEHSLHLVVVVHFRVSISETETDDRRLRTCRGDWSSRARGGTRAMRSGFRCTASRRADKTRDGKFAIRCAADAARHPWKTTRQFYAKYICDPFTSNRWNSPSFHSAHEMFFYNRPKSHTSKICRFSLFFTFFSEFFWRENSFYFLHRKTVQLSFDYLCPILNENHFCT